MTAYRGLYVPLTADGTGTTPLEARLALAATIAQNSPGVPRAGLLFQGNNNVVAGTGNMSYNVAPCSPVIVRSANDGVYTMALVGTTNIITTAAPASGSRWDLIFVKQNDVSRGDGDNAPVLGVVQGIAASTPAKPYASVPEGAYVLAEAEVKVGATATNGAQVTITQMWRHTAMRGAPIPVRNTTERGEITAYTGAKIIRLDQRAIEQVYTGSEWYGSMSASGTMPIAGIPNGDSTGQIQVNFGTTFPGIPSVTMSPASSRETSSVVSTTITTTSFKYTADNRSGGYAAAGNGTWTAIYVLK